MKANSLGVDSTPTVFINGQEMSGGVAPLPRLRAALDKALKNSGTVAAQHRQASSAQELKPVLYLIYPRNGFCF